MNGNSALKENQDEISISPSFFIIFFSFHLAHYAERTASAGWGSQDIKSCV